jgi:hypothetical protein
VTARWSREGDDLATVCEACGTAFPKSRKVKECARYGGARGPNLIEKLELDLSDRSGAAEDLVGGAMQFAAAAWLRRERGVAWSTAFLDEPFGSLDEAHRRGLASPRRPSCRARASIHVSHNLA